MSHALGGVVFDLGNVLITWDPEVAIAAGVGSAEARRFLTASDFDFYAYNHHQDAGRGWEDAVVEVRETHPHWVEHVEAYRTNYVESIRYPVPGTPDVLRELHAAGVPLWALTNWSQEQFPAALDLHEFLTLFDGVVVSGAERVAKPDPRIYQILAERSGIPLDRLAFIDDREANVAAAVELGMDGIVFTDADELRADLSKRGLQV